MSEHANFTIHRGNHQPLRYTMTTNGSVAGTTTLFTVRKTNKSLDPPTLSIAGTIVDAGSPSTPGIFDVTLTKALTLPLELRPYVHSFNRTNVGAEVTFTDGVMTVKSDIEHQV